MKDAFALANAWDTRAKNQAAEGDAENKAESAQRQSIEAEETAATADAREAAAVGTNAQQQKIKEEQRKHITELINKQARQALQNKIPQIDAAPAKPVPKAEPKPVPEAVPEPKPAPKPEAEKKPRPKPAPKPKPVAKSKPAPEEKLELETESKSSAESASVIETKATVSAAENSAKSTAPPAATEGETESDAPAEVESSAPEKIGNDAQAESEVNAPDEAEEDAQVEDDAEPETINPETATEPEKTSPPAKKPKRTKRKIKVKVKPKAVIVTLLVLVVAAAIAICTYAALTRWTFANDEQDIQGTWAVAGQTNKVLITQDKIKLAADATYSYTLDTQAKCINETLGNMTGSARYRFSPDKTQLAIFDAQENTQALSWTETAMSDFDWAFKCIIASITGATPPDLLGGQSGVVLQKVKATLDEDI